MTLKRKAEWTLLWASTLASLTVGAQTPLQSAPEYKPGELLLKLQPGSSGIQLDEEILSVRPFRIPPSFRSQDIERWRIATVAEETDLAQLKAELLVHPAVETVEFNYRIGTSELPNDPSFPELWGLNNDGQTGGITDADIDAPEGWRLTEGALAPVIVGLIDTGVDYGHPDLAPNMWTNPGEIAGNGIDDDGNGYVDDVHGWDFVNDDNDPMDDNGHGTHLAGTIAAVADNGIGVAGVSPNARVIALKIMGSDGYGYNSNAVEALLYTVGSGASVANNSWSSFGFSHAFADALGVAETAGSLVVVPAGNSGTDNDQAPQYPSGYDVDNVVAVAATDATDTLALFSNFGQHSVDLAAPGEAILSTSPGNTYVGKSGTSMAAAYVTGALAVVLGSDPNGSYRAIRERLLRGTDPLPALLGKVATAGRLNLKRALGTSAAIIGPDFESSSGLEMDGNGIPSVAISGPTAVELGHPTDFNYFTYTATASDPDGDPLTLAWYKDGVLVGDGQVFGTNFGSPGTYQIGVIASDGQDSALAVMEVIVEGSEDQPPILELTGPSTIAPHRPAPFSVSVDDPDDTSFTFTWWVDGAIVKSSPGFGYSYITTSFTTPGNHSVSVEVNDGNNTVTAELVVEVTNVPPRVEISTLSPLPATRIAPVEFHALAADSNNDPLTYEWRVDGNAVGAEMRLTHQFATLGMHTVEVVVSDGYDTASSAPEVEVVNLAPQVDLRGPGKADRIRPATYDAFGTVDPDNDPLDYTWRVNGEVAGSGPVLTFSFNTPGTHTIELTVSDGTDSVSMSRETTVINLHPVAEPGPAQTVRQISTVTLAGSGSDPEGDRLTYSWRQLSGPSVTLASDNAPITSFEAPNLRGAPSALMEFELTVTDEWGSSHSDTTTVNVERNANLK